MANEVRQHTVYSDLNTLDLGLELRLRELKAQEDAAANQAQELRAVFQQDIDEGRLLIRQEGCIVVIQLLEKDSFPSGSAGLEPGSRETLARIGSARRRDDRSDHRLGTHRRCAGSQRAALIAPIGSYRRRARRP